MTTTAGRSAVAAWALVAALAGCSLPGPDTGADTVATPTPSASTAQDAGAPTETLDPSVTPPPARTERATTLRERPPHPVSIRALWEKRYDGRDLRLLRVLARTDAYTTYYATYRSGRLTVSGRVNVPRGRGPHPAVVLAHGYIDPAYYVNGQGLAREQDYLARAGFVTFHVDYRNHAGSSRDPRNDVRLRLGYTEDVVNAVLALRAGPRFVDDDRVALLGRSMGGGVLYNVLAVRPDLVGAAVAFAPVSSLAADSFNRWVRPDAGRSGVAQEILERYGAPEDNPGFWRRASPRPYFDRFETPLLVHHGTSDDSCPIRWTYRTVAALERAGAPVTLRVYDGEEHAFGPQWPLSMQRTVAFLRRHLDL